ncbi:MAG: glycosyltransferase family 4 protein [Candidatus Eisenbacteria bacterium]
MKNLTPAEFQTKLHGVKAPVTISFYMHKAYPLFLKDSSAFEDEVGGAEMDFYVIATELAKNKDFAITFYTGDYGQEDMMRITDNLTMRKFPYWEPDAYPKWYHKIVRRVLCFWTVLNDRSDVFFSEAHSELWGYVVLVRKFLMRKPTVYRIASDLDIKPSEDKKSDTFYRIFAFGLRHTDFVIAQNAAQRHILESELNKKTVEIKNALWDIPTPPDIVRRKENVLWVGRGIPLKQPMKFVELARSLPKERFLMVFPGKGALKDEVVRESEKLSNLEVVDFIDPKTIQETYNRAKCLVNTSTHEGFPNSFVQALMGGTPVVGLNVNPDGILDRLDIGHCCNGDIAQATEFIRTLSGKRMEELYANCRAYFKENHDISTVIKKYEALFADIASKRAT